MRDGRFNTTENLAISALISGLFFVSGFSALTYQVVWQRVLTQSVGSDSLSVVLVVAIFLFSLGSGAEFARISLQRWRFNIAVLYALLEVAIGLYGFGSVALIRSVNEAASAFGLTSLVIDALVNFVVLAPPVFAMGMTSPLIVQIATRKLETLGRTTGWFYGINIAGAAAGAFATGLVLIELMGLTKTCWLAAGLNVAIGVTMILTFWRKMEGEPDTLRKSRQTGPLLRVPSISALFFGFGTLALQVVFFRILSNYFTLATLVFPVVLGVYLILMALGQLFGGYFADRFPDRLPTVIAAFAAAGALSFTIVLLFPPHYATQFGAIAFTSFNGSLLPLELKHLIGDPSPWIVTVFSAVFMTAVLFWASLFPVMLRLVTKQVTDVGNEFARLYVIYAAGNVLGTVVCGYLFLPKLGTSTTAILTVLIVCTGSALLLGKRHWRLEGAAIGTAVVAAILMIPANYYKGFSFGDYQVTKVYEGRNGVATLVSTPRFYHIIDMNRTASASALVRDPADSDRYQAWRWNHSELFAADPEFRPKRILVIGIGHAYLIDALLDWPFLERLVVVDISEEIITAVRENTKTHTRRIFEDPRVEIVIDDGRRYTQKALAIRSSFDLIQIKVNEPWHSGSSNLFTTEFLASAKLLLSNGGYLGVRPLLGHLTDGFEVFGNAMYSPGHYHMFFKNGQMTVPDKLLITPEIAGGWQAELPGGARTGQREGHIEFAFINSLVPTGVEHNTDDSPSFEYYWMRKKLGSWVSPRVEIGPEHFQAHLRALPVSYDN